MSTCETWLDKKLGTRVLKGLYLWQENLRWWSCVLSLYVAETSIPRKTNNMQEWCLNGIHLNLWKTIQSEVITWCTSASVNMLVTQQTYFIIICYSDKGVYKRKAFKFCNEVYSSCANFCLWKRNTDMEKKIYGQSTYIWASNL